MVREKFKRKWYFFHKKDKRFNYRIIRKVFFSLDKYPLKYGLKSLFFLFQHIENRKKDLLYRAPPCYQANLFSYSCNFIFHTYNNGMIGHGGGGRCQNAQNNLLEKLIRNYFCTNL